LGRSVYFGCVVLLATAILQGLTGFETDSLCSQLQVSKRTLRRWLLYFKDTFPKSKLWRRLRGCLPPACAGSLMPLGLLQSYPNPFFENVFLAVCCNLIGGVFATSATLTEGAAM
jgi:hypothetical protein